MKYSILFIQENKEIQYRIYMRNDEYLFPVHKNIIQITQIFYHFCIIRCRRKFVLIYIFCSRNGVMIFYYLRYKIKIFNNFQIFRRFE